MENHKNPLVAAFGHEKQWVNWRHEERDGKKTKIPYSTNGTMASSTNPSTWSTYNEVVRSSDKVGIIFRSDRPLLGIDIDHVIEGGVLPEKIQSFVDAANTYTEISPSGTGLHLYLALTSPLELSANRRSPFEAYTKARYFTVTSIPFGTPRPLRTTSPEEALELLRLIGYPWQALKAPQASQNPPQSAEPAQTLDDSVLLEKMFSAKNGPKTKALYEGDIASYGDDTSKADLALLSGLAFWTRKDGSQMERIWLASPLGRRNKTQERADYRKRTIAVAIENCTEVYKGSDRNLDRKSGGSKSRAVLVRLADVAPEPISWLWPGRIALGKITLFAGDPGFGKSLLTVDLAARVSIGAEWPDHSASAPLGDTVMLSIEDDPGDTIRPRLDAAGADCTRVHILKSIEVSDGSGVKRRTLSFKHDMEALEEALKSLPECRLVVVDPISAYLDDIDSHKNADVRGLLAPLAELAARLKIAIVLIQHLNKGNAGTKALYRPMGSLAFIAAARAAYIVTKDKDTADRRLMLPAKNNIAKDTTGMAYAVVTADNGLPRIIWESIPITITADQALAESFVSEEPAEKDWAQMFLLDLLAEGPVDAREATKQAKQASVSDKSLRRARESLGVKPIKKGFNGGWVWALPVEGAQKDEDVPIDMEGILEANGHLGDSHDSD